MIQLITEQHKAIARHKQETDPFLCRILSVAAMYGAYPFADCWVQVQQDIWQPVAYLSKMDGVLTLFATPNADFDEISTFLDVIGASLVLCHKQCAQKLGMNPTRTGVMLKWQEQQIKEQVMIKNPALQQVYQVLESCKSAEFQPPKFEPFYLDMSHRIRHNGAKVAGILKNKQLAACAMTVAETERTAVIGAVAVKPDFRGRGLGKAVVNGLLNSCLHQNQTQLYVFCNTNRNRQFYESLGFSSCGAWAEIERN